MMGEFSDKTTAERLAMHAAIMEELRSRNIPRSADNPTRNLAEYLLRASR